MTRSCENAPVHSELFAYSTLKTMGTGDATDAAGTSSTVRRDCPFPTRSGTVRLDDGPLLILSTMNWIVGSEVAHLVSLMLATVRRPNCTCGFPACSFHEDLATPRRKRRN
jgi:hypothetical protein